MAISTKKPWTMSKDEEQLVLNHVKKILSQQQVFRLDDYFVSNCSKSLKLPEMHVYKILYSLVKRKILLPGTVLTRNQVMENETRSLILETIKNHPSIHVRALGEHIKKSSGLIRAHLEVLENFRFIRVKKYNNPKFTMIFLRDFPDKFDEFFLIWKNKNAGRILNMLYRKNSTLRELSESLDLDPTTIKYHILKLQNYNLVFLLSEDDQGKFTFNQNKKVDYIEYMKNFGP